MNLASIVDHHPGERVALITSDGVVSYGALRSAVARYRARLVAAGVGPGDGVALVAPNSPAFVVAYLAILGAGAVAVPLNPASPPSERDGQIAAADVRAVVAGLTLERPPPDVMLLDGPTLDPPVGADRAPPGVGAAPAGGGAAAGSAVVERDGGDVAVLSFTAGTAGAPRAAMLTHANLLANLDQLRRHPGPRVGPDDVVLGVLPLFHVFGLNVVLGAALVEGAAVLLADGAGPDLLPRIVEARVSVLVGSPALYAALLASPPARDEASGAVRLAVSGAAPCPPELGAAFRARFGVPLRQGYGLTEASPVVTAAVDDDHPRASSVGIPVPGVELRLVDAEGADALDGDPGEVWVRGANVFGGYWRDPEATAAVLNEDGWLRTGDIGVLGDDGQLSIVDRAKDLIIVSGFNVWPAEVEAVILDLPGVAEAAVVGRDDPIRGEVVVGYVVLEEGVALEAEAIRAHTASRLARYKCPIEVMIVASLPHGLAGKLLRRALREHRR